MKQERGITLIALVITIIVLLILAGVSIAMLTGENGLLNRSKAAVIESKIAECKEHVILTVNELVEEFYEKKFAGPESQRPTQDKSSEYVADKIGTKLEEKYATAPTTVTGDTVIITLKEKDPNDTTKDITGTYSKTDGKIVWSYNGRIDSSVNPDS